MGQYWEYLSIDQRRSSGHLGKLGEFFTSTTSDKLLYLLAVPVVPVEEYSTRKGAEVAGAWAGNRVICLGDYADSWPEGVVTDGDFSHLESDEDRAERNPQIFMDSCSVFRNVDYGYHKEASYPNNRTWALRNLSKKLYVRSDRIPTIEDTGKTFTYESHHGLAGYPNLGHVLLANIVWSDDPSTSMSYSDVQGSWAGNRIDVRLLDDVEEEMQEEGWKDISQQEAIRLYEIFLDEGDADGELPEEPKGMAALE